MQLYCPSEQSRYKDKNAIIAGVQALVHVLLELVREVIVTFHPPSPIDFGIRGINETFSGNLASE